MGVGAIVGDIAEKVGGDFVRNVGDVLTKETAAYGFLRSGKALLEQSKVGKVLSDFITHEYEPSARQAGESILKSKISAGIAPAVAAKESAVEAWSEARKQAFGKNDEGLVTAVHQITKEKGIIHGNAVADMLGIYLHDTQQFWRTRNVAGKAGSSQVINLTKTGIDRAPSFQAIKDVETKLRQTFSWMYTPLIAIPHVSQVANILLDSSVRDVAKGVVELSSKETGPALRAQILKSGALFDETRFQMLEDAQGKGFFYKMFHHPGFNWVRRQEINLAAVSGKNAALDAAAKLRYDGGDKWARYTLGKLGIDANKVLEQKFELTEGDILKAMHAEANRTIFLRSGLNTPWRWEESAVSRTMALYKQFQFRQGAFLADVFKNSYKHGGAKEFTKTLATFSLAFPVFGELVHSLENIAVGDNPFSRDKKDKFANNEYFDAMAHAAGFGMFYSLWRAGLWNNFKGSLEGPVFSTIEDFLSDTKKVGKASVYYSEGKNKKGRKEIKSAARNIISKGGIPGRLVGHLMQDKKN